MKLRAGWAVTAGLVLAATVAHAQGLAPYNAGQSPYRAVSDFEEPYGGVPPAPPPYPVPPAYVPSTPYGYEPELLPPHEVYAILRENGFQPLGIPHRHGYVYDISVMDQEGEDGRLIIDGRNGRIIRFAPAYWGGRSEMVQPSPPYGMQAALPPPIAVRGVPRPPAPIPHVASRTVPLPVSKPAAVAATRPDEPIQQQSAAAHKPADNATSAQAQASAPTSAPATTGATGEVKPQPVIRPTEPMPAVQGLE
jgi:hypothetical protein